MTSRPFAEVIGDPIGHSLSPTIHGFWLGALGIEADYRRRQVEKGGLATYLAEVRADPAWRGSNVTMPLKLEALLAADTPSDAAIAAGAANMLVPKDGTVDADNSDVGAIATLLDGLRADGAAMDGVTLLGNGGAARAALAAFRLAGVGPVIVQARDMAAGRALGVEFDVAHVRPLTAPVTTAGLLNATPLGMAGKGCLNCELGAMPADGWVFDCVSVPAETPLVVAARARGLRVVLGLEMLVEQAAASFVRFFGAAPPRARDAELMRQLAP
ncbi:shikimate dehydrogenase [Sphingomonas sp. ASV193]|uniref:shikimate dehydrogenase family protein n=1 Tax=Sphingomonas sp. ASV193 TaxID=3144405 RepID=UPI0032E8BD5E